MQTFEFRLPPLILVGPYSWHRIGDEAARLGAKKALIVADEFLVTSMRASEMQSFLEAHRIPSVVYDKGMREPEDTHVEEGLKLLREAECDLVIGFGGGSAIDTAKAIAIMATNPGSIADYMGANKVKNPRLPLIAVPTTAGTGSEVTKFDIITDTTNDVKMLISDPHVIPDVAIVDPTLTVTCPPKVTASAGIDALIHAIEAYVSKRANPISDLLALSASRRISANLRRAWSDPDDLEARSEVMLGALEAGMSFVNSSVALVHGMSRPIGAYFHIPHGLSNAMLLPTVIEYSLEGALERYADIARAMGEEVEGLSIDEAARRAVVAARELNEDLEVPSLSQAGIDPERLAEVATTMAQDAIASGSPSNNPRVPTVEEIVELYKKAL